MSGSLQAILKCSASIRVRRGDGRRSCKRRRLCGGRRAGGLSRRNRPGSVWPSGVSRGAKRPHARSRPTLSAVARSWMSSILDVLGDGCLRRHPLRANRTRSNSWAEDRIAWKLFGSEAPRVIERTTLDALEDNGRVFGAGCSIQPRSSLRDTRTAAISPGGFISAATRRRWSFALDHDRSCRSDFDGSQVGASASAPADGNSRAAVANATVGFPHVSGGACRQVVLGCLLRRRVSRRGGVHGSALGFAGRPRPIRRLPRGLGRSALLKEIRDAALIGPVVACDASPWHQRAPVGSDLLRVGNAALCSDPLSSQGVQHALTSGYQAAIVANTWLRAPARADTATSFFHERHGEAGERTLRVCNHFYALAAERFRTAFWGERSMVSPGTGRNNASASALSEADS